MASTGQFNISCIGPVSVEINQPGILGLFKGLIAADCHDISRKGMQVGTKSELKMGQRVVVDIIAHDLRVEELRGIVSSTTVVDDHYFYEIDFTRARQNRDTMHCLMQLKSRLQADQSLEA